MMRTAALPKFPPEKPGGYPPRTLFPFFPEPYYQCDCGEVVKVPSADLFIPTADMRVVFQHGENPEARHVEGDFVLLDDALTARLARWVDAVHSYQRHHAGEPETAVLSQPSRKTER